MQRNQYLSDAGKLAGIYILLYLAALFIPLLGIICLFALPIPFVIYSYRYEEKHVIGFTGFVALLVVIIGGIINLFGTLLFAGIGYMIGRAYKKQVRPVDMFMKTLVVTLLGLVALIVVSSLLFDINFIDNVRSTIQESTSTVIHTMSENGIKVSDEQEKMIYSVTNFFQELVPMMLLLISAVLTLLACILSQNVSKRFQIEPVRIGKMYEYELPKNFIWYYFVILIIGFFSIDPDTFLYTVRLNVTTVFQILFILQGLSLISYFIYSKKKPRILFVFTVVVTLLVPIMFPFIEFLGIIDLGFQVRKRLKQ